MAKKTGTKTEARKFRGFAQIVSDDANAEALRKLAERVKRGEPLWYDARKKLTVENGEDDASA